MSLSDKIYTEIRRHGELVFPAREALCPGSLGEAPKSIPLFRASDHFEMRVVVSPETFDRLRSEPFDSGFEYPTLAGEPFRFRGYEIIVDERVRGLFYEVLLKVK